MPPRVVVLAPDEKEVWVVDAFDRRLHIAAYFRRDGQAAEADGGHSTPPRAAGLDTFSIDGRYAHPSTGEVIEVQTRRIVAGLKDEQGVEVHREKLLEIDFNGGQTVRTGDQFGIRRVTRK